MEWNRSNYLRLALLLLLFIFTVYYILVQSNSYELRSTVQVLYRIINRSRIVDLLGLNSNTTTTITPNRQVNVTTTLISSVTTMTRILHINEKLTVKPAVPLTTTAPTRLPTTLDPALLVVERPPPASRLKQNNDMKSSIAVFVFHTKHHVLADAQIYLVRKLAVNLAAVELFVDDVPSEDMLKVAKSHKAELHNYPIERHQNRRSGSDRNTAVVNWALARRAKRYLGNGTAILLLDGDVFPLSPFDSITLLNSRDVVCRKHPALFARYCWIGLICIGPQLYDTIDNFDVSQMIRNGYAYDSGGKTVEYFLKYPNASFSWMQETIFIRPDNNLFWGAFDNDIQWIRSNFYVCDKCGAEVFVSPFNNSNAVFYHMISATSEWRFPHQNPRRQAIHDAIMKSPYGPNNNFVIDHIHSSVEKVKKMRWIPYFGNLTCENVCKGRY
ncbi:unnamed protein product [Adineta ricciae]|uniref:Uncharacterized protein n=1 Tax=Adineta ricciae TaxID=249248 RepID=A0A815HWD0_ADIRI|nr:unnamed protein product [Adineta ricciae]